MLNRSSVLLLRSLSLFCFFLVLSVSLLNVEALNDHHEYASELGSMVKRGERKPLVETEYGEISAVRISDGTRGLYYMHFIALEPNSLFLPVLLHADMVFYVHTGSGRLSWADEKDTRRLNIKRGDVYRLQPGSVFFIESDLEPEREKLRIYAIFSNNDEESFDSAIGAYSSISDLVLGFDDKVLQSAFKVPEDLIEALRNTTRPPPMIHALPGQKKSTIWEFETRFLKAFVGGRGVNMHAMNGKKKKTKTFNILDADPDFRNCNGWSLTVDRKDLNLLKDSNIGIFMVNLTKGSMMGPHWNPMATEVAVVLHGQGMVRVVCPTTAKKSSCKNMRFRVEEGDVFAVPRFHPMAQMSFNNDSFVFMGFSTTRRRNYPQFLAGKSSVLQTIDNRVLAKKLKRKRRKRKLRRERKKKKKKREEKEKKKKRREEEEKKREEEEAKRREEEEAKKREEEAKRREEEEEARKREEEKKREEEEAKKREEERERREREEEERRREEEEKQRQEEERKREEEEEERRREKEKERQEDEEERRRREEAAKREEEEARRQEEKRQRGEGQEEEHWRREQEDNVGGLGQRRVLKHVFLEGFIHVP
ncbi:hypothetical protein Patl1_28889 [Pistacia atlantica]|uniref:Uncharacterized protein n=1 Tax=Pistacia atlantica TaxID=434234 RepID=A0ACC1BCV8_9ROSI|nr:hypothetical protein Patl1_28889 [Pistacia atlantica]